jgi:hypothetical protein
MSLDEPLPTPVQSLPCGRVPSKTNTDLPEGEDVNSYPHRAIIVIGNQDPAEAVLREAEHYDEVFVIARAVPMPSDRWVIDEDAARSLARARLRRALARLRSRGVRARGAVGDANAAAARDDALAYFPADAIL